jgi:glycosyltransferase involved in cell wall biosynthesis
MLQSDDPSLDVTVVMAVKNEAKYLADALSSILSQEGVSFEIVLIDDGSTDASFEIAERFSRNDSRVRVLRNPNPGKARAFNLGVSLARGRFACLFAGDDLMPIGSLSKRFHRVKSMGDESPVVGLCKLTTFSADPRFDGVTIPRRAGQSSLSGVSPLMNRIARERIFPVPEVLPNEDTWMQVAITMFPDFRVLPSDIVGCLWRVHSNNSIDIRLGFDDFNKHITPRRGAFGLFLKKYGDAIGQSKRVELEGLVECEERRLRGDLLGVLMSRTSIVERLRAASMIGPKLFALRTRFYRLTSGW